MVELVRRRHCAPKCRLKFIPLSGKVFTRTIPKMKELDGGGELSPESQIHPAGVAAGQILTIQKATQ